MSIKPLLYSPPGKRLKKKPKTKKQLFVYVCVCVCIYIKGFCYRPKIILKSAYS